MRLFVSRSVYPFDGFFYPPILSSSCLCVYLLSFNRGVGPLIFAPVRTAENPKQLISSTTMSTPSQYNSLLLSKQTPFWTFILVRCPPKHELSLMSFSRGSSSSLEQHVLSSHVCKKLSRMWWELVEFNSQLSSNLDRTIKGNIKIAEEKLERCCLYWHLMIAIFSTYS